MADINSMPVAKFMQMERMAAEWYIRLIPTTPDNSIPTHEEKVFALRQLLITPPFPIRHLGVSLGLAPSNHLVDGGVVLGRSRSDTDRSSGGVDYPIVSRNHAQFLVSGRGSVYLIDLKSHHGTSIQGIKDTTPITLESFCGVRLQHEDTIIIGKEVSDSNKGSFKPITYRIEFRYPELGCSKPKYSNNTRKSLVGLTEQRARDKLASTLELPHIIPHIIETTSYQQDHRVSDRLMELHGIDPDATAELTDDEGSLVEYSEHHDFDSFSETGWSEGSSYVSTSPDVDAVVKPATTEQPPPLDLGASLFTPPRPQPVPVESGDIETDGLSPGSRIIDASLEITETGTELIQDVKPFAVQAPPPSSPEVKPQINGIEVSQIKSTHESTIENPDDFDQSRSPPRSGGYRVPLSVLYMSEEETEGSVHGANSPAFVDASSPAHSPVLESDAAPGPDSPLVFSSPAPSEPPSSPGRHLTSSAPGRSEPDDTGVGEFDDGFRDDYGKFYSYSEDENEDKDDEESLGGDVRSHIDSNISITSDCDGDDVAKNFDEDQNEGISVREGDDLPLRGDISNVSQYGESEAGADDDERVVENHNSRWHINSSISNISEFGDSAVDETFDDTSEKVEKERDNRNLAETEDKGTKEDISARDENESAQEPGYDAEYDQAASDAKEARQRVVDILSQHYDIDGNHDVPSSHRRIRDPSPDQLARLRTVVPADAANTECEPPATPVVKDTAMQTDSEHANPHPDTSPERFSSDSPVPRSETPSPSVPSSVGLITPEISNLIALPEPESPTNRLKRSRDEAGLDLLDGPGSNASIQAFRILATDAEPQAKRRSVGSAIGLVMLGAALGSVGTIAGLMQLAP